jgi:hypothetical protein
MKKINITFAWSYLLAYYYVINSAPQNANRIMPANNMVYLIRKLSANFMFLVAF